MDPSLLRLYNDELTHLREVGAEFAKEFRSPSAFEREYVAVRSKRVV